MGELTNLIKLERWKQKAAAESIEPQQTTQPGEEPSQTRTVEHSGLCATQFNRNALCDCKTKR